MKTLKILALIILAGYILLGFRSIENLADKPFTEDGYYSLSVASNIASGKGVTYDGVQLTNGFQPLFTFICVPVMMISSGNIELALRIIYFLSLIVFAFSGILLAKLVQIVYSEEASQKYFWITLFLFYSAASNYLMFHNGLETGFLVFIVLVAFHYFVKSDTKNIWNLFILGVLLGLIVLTRIDTVFFVIIFCIMLSANAKSKKVASFFVPGITSFVISSPWWIYNYFYFGSIVPSSGVAQQEILALPFWRLSAFFDAVLINTMPFSWTADKVINGWTGVIIRLIMLGGILYFIRKFYQSAHLSGNPRSKIFLTSLVISLIIITGWYLFTTWAIYFYARYFILILIPGTVLMAYFFKILSDKKKIIFASFISLIFILSVIFISMMYFKSGYSGSTFLTEQLPLVKKNVPETEIVAAAQTGTLGFFRSNVVNLDGKVNADAIRYRNNMTDYLNLRKINWFCDWRMGVDRFLGKNPESKGWRLVDSSKFFLLYHKEVLILN